MQTKKSIYEFLTTDDNLHLITELSEELDLFREEMHKVFWSRYNQLMTTKFSTCEFNDQWQFTPFNLHQLSKPWGRAWIRPKNDGTKKLALGLSIAQDGRPSNFRLAYCVAWNNRSSEVHFDSSVMLKFKAKLATHKIITPGDWDLLWGYSGWRIFDPEFLGELYGDPDGWCQNIVDNSWDLFLEVRGEMEHINKEVSNIRI